MIDFDKREVFCHILKSWSLGFRCCDDLSGRMRGIGSYLVSNPTLPRRLRKCLKGKRFLSIITEVFLERLGKGFVEKGPGELSRGALQMRMTFFQSQIHYPRQCQRQPKTFKCKGDNTLPLITSIHYLNYILLHYY